jgi:hypothetical protein
MSSIDRDIRRIQRAAGSATTRSSSSKIRLILPPNMTSTAGKPRESINLNQRLLNEQARMLETMRAAEQ